MTKTMKDFRLCSLYILMILTTGCGDPKVGGESRVAGEMQARTDQIAGSDLPSDFAGVARDGGILAFKGRPENNGCLSFGPYLSQEGSPVKVTGLFDFEVKISPDSHKECTKREPITKRCIEETKYIHESGFRLDLVAVDQSGNSIASDFKWYSNERDISRQKVALQLANWQGGGLHKVEMRMCELHGGEFDIKIYGIDLNWAWKPVCHFQFECTKIEEIKAYIANVKHTLPTMSRSLLTYIASYYTLKEADTSLACFIDEVQQTNLNEDVIAVLRKKYQDAFHKDLPAGLDCSALPKHVLQKEFCVVERDSPVCKIFWAHGDVARWLADTYLKLYLYNDEAKVVEDNPNLAQEIEALMQEITTTLQVQNRGS